MSSWNAWPAAPAPPTPPATQRLLGVLIALLAAIVAVIAVGAVVIDQRTHVPADRPTAPATPAAPTSPWSPSPPSTSPSSPVPSDDPEATLTRNPLYAQTMPASDCAQPPRPLPEDRAAEERYLTTLVDCMLAAYAAPVAASGHTLTTPAVTVYRGSVQTPCGSAAPGYPVFYCPANEGVYASTGALADYGQGLRLAGYWMVFHEFAHHVQHRIGVLEAAYTRDEDREAISRRIELQADCHLGITAHTVRSTRLTAGDQEEMRLWRAAAADATHGSTASQLHWIARGYQTRDLGRCSTWTATRDID